MTSRSDRHLATLELLLLWEGAISNRRLREVLGVSQVHASRIIAAFKEAHQGTLDQADHVSPIVATERFTPRFSGAAPDDYLALLSAEEGPLEDARIDLAPVRAEIFVHLNVASRNRTGVEIEYSSLTTPGTRTRLVFPHALVRAPRRWHLRAWCSQAQDWRDFALGRISDARPVAVTAPRASADDVRWHEVLDLTIGPHPALDDWQFEVVAREYLRGQATRTLRVRSALAPYVLADLAVATDVQAQTPPAYQLAVRDKIDPKDLWSRARGASP